MHLVVGRTPGPGDAYPPAQASLRLLGPHRSQLHTLVWIMISLPCIGLDWIIPSSHLTLSVHKGHRIDQGQAVKPPPSV